MPAPLPTCHLNGEWLPLAAARISPFAYLQAVPVEILTGLRSGALAREALLYQWLWVGGMMILLSLLWRRAIRHYEAFGG